MSVETGNFPLLLAALLGVGGLHGIFFYSSLGRKLASWCALQAGLVLFFLLRSPMTSLSKVLVLETALVTAVVALVLVAFLMEARKHPGKAGSKAGTGRRDTT
jgi:hypothetical protein